jgi:alpha-glucosidase
LRNTDGEKKLPDLMVVTPDDKRPPVDVSITRKDSLVIVSSNALKIALAPEGNGSVSITVTNAKGENVVENWELNTRSDTSSLPLHPNEHIYGFGDKRAAIDQRGNTLEMLNHDALGSVGNDSYKSVPFFRSSNGFSLFFHNWNPAIFDVGQSSPDRLKMDGKGGKLDYYVFVDQDPKKIISQYTELTGRPAMLPRWTFGFHQSKASYATPEEMLDVAKTMREKHLPFDTIYFDDFDNENTPRTFVDTLKNRYSFPSCGRTGRVSTSRTRTGLR